MKKKIFKKGVLTAFTVSMLTTAARADGNIAGSQFGKGLTNMINDLSNFLLVLGPSIAGVAGAYYLIRRSMANEQDGYSWNKRLTIALVCGVGVLVFGGILKLVASYFI